VIKRGLHDSLSTPVVSSRIERLSIGDLFIVEIQGEIGNGHRELLMSICDPARMGRMAGCMIDFAPSARLSPAAARAIRDAINALAAGGTTAVLVVPSGTQPYLEEIVDCVCVVANRKEARAALASVPNHRRRPLRTSSTDRVIFPEHHW
jgi:threonine dehydrogenase-like Zn-dependent dehydrogenase